MTKRRADVGDRIQRVLDLSGVPFRVEEGAKHLKIFVCGRLVAVTPRSRRGTEAVRFGGDNALAAVRRAVRACNGRLE